MTACFFENRAARGAIIAAFGLGSILGCEKKTKSVPQESPPPAAPASSPPPAAPAPSAEVPDWWQQLKTRAASLPSTELGAKLNQVKSAVSQLPLRAELKPLAIEIAVQAYRLGGKTGEGFKKADQIADDGLRYLGIEDPDARAQVKKVAIRLLPVVGPAEHYLSARKLFHEGMQVEDEAKMQQARRECFVACIEMGLDLTVIGATGNIDAAARQADRALSLLKKTRFLAKFTSAEFDVLSPLADAALSDARTFELMNQLLLLDPSQYKPAWLAPENPVSPTPR